MSRIQRIVIEQYDEKYAPPEEHVLQISSVGPRVFIDVCEFKETHEETMTKSIAHVVVGGAELLAALLALTDAKVADDVRRQLPKGHPDA
jgi:hypothetical protein